MASVQWDRLKEIVDAFHEESPDDLEAWLGRRCGDNEALRREARSLLRADREGRLSDEDWAADRLSEEFSGERRGAGSGLQEAGAGLLGAGEEARVTVGDYRLLEEIGVGGMSVVYRAERAEAGFQQTVAVKVLQRRLSEGEARRRFEAERQVLASLDHPGIARLIDGGITGGGVPDSGRPYLVMEHVDGVPITEYARENDLGLEARLDLIQQVAEALQAAHRQLVVHRDLKPSNVFVTETESGPRVKLLDFGIAKLLGDALPVTRPQTQTGRRPMTPSYAAPEQVAGEEISTQTDVYQLGMLAYELLAGRRPFDLEDTSLAETERIITEEPPPPLPDQTTGEGTEGEGVPPAELRGDLDVIVRKALRKEPGRRYASVEALVEDLRRFRAEEPVRARPATAAYRARKFFRRNAIGMGVAAAFLAVIAVAAALLLQQRNRARENAEAAEREAQKAEAVSGYLIDLLQSARPDESAGEEVTAADMLRRGRERIERLDGQPAVQARMLQLLGNAHRERAEYERAADLLRQSLRARDSLHASAHKSVANTIEELALLQQQRGLYQQADSLWRKALRSQRKLFSSGSPKLWEPLNNLGIVASRAGRLAQADSFYQRAVSVLQNSPQPDSGKLANTMMNWAGSRVERGKYGKADSLYRQSLAIQRRIGSPPHPGIALTVVNLGLVRKNQQLFVEADSLLQRGLSMLRSVYDTPHPLIAISLNHHARVMLRSRRVSEADSLSQRAMRMGKQVLSSSNPRLGYILTTRGTVLGKKGKLDRALSLQEQARSIFQDQLSPSHLEMARVQWRLGQVLMELGRYRRTEELLQKSLKAYRQAGKERRVEQVRTDISGLYDKWEKPGEVTVLDTSAKTLR